MKPQSFLIYFFTLTFLTASMCKKKPVDPIDQLPAETQTGANTFGCLVNGKVFLPKGPSLSPILTCYYQYIYSPSPSGYVFQIAGYDKSDGDNRYSIVLLIDSVKIQQGQMIPIKKTERGKASGTYYVSINLISNDFFTTDISAGFLFIKKLDETNQIVAGTFWFNAVNSNGDAVKITDGRFDMHYTR